MKRTLLIVACFLVAAATIAIQKSSVSVAQDNKTRIVPLAKPASPDILASLVASDAYQYACSIRSTTGGENISLGDSTADHPQYCNVAAKGIESYFGLPMKTDGEYDAELPSSVYCRIKVVSVVDDIAQVKLTVGHATDVEKTNGVATWNEQVWTVDREVRFDETDTVQLTAPNGKTAPNFEVRYRVRKFEGKPE